MHTLDEIDVKILVELLKDGRKSFTDIAKQCNKSKDVICNHYKELKNAGIIVGSTIQFNYSKFGYSAVAVIMLSLDSQYIPETLEHLKTIPNIFSFCNYNSPPYSIIVISTLKDLRDLDYAKEIMSKQNQTNEIKTSLWTDVRNIPENVLEGDFEKETKNADEKGSHAQIDIDFHDILVKIDEIDLQIVERLSQNGRMPFSKIAQEIGVSTDNISRRYEKLVKNNFIKVSIQFNPVKLDYQCILAINVAVADQRETNKIVDKLSKIKGVSYIVKLSGNYDLSLVALVKSSEEIIEINEKITEIPNIKKIEASLRKIPLFWPGPRQYISTF